MRHRSLRAVAIVILLSRLATRSRGLPYGDVTSKLNGSIVTDQEVEEAAW